MQKADTEPPVALVVKADGKDMSWKACHKRFEKRVRDAIAVRVETLKKSNGSIRYDDCAMYTMYEEEFIDGLDDAKECYYRGLKMSLTARCTLLRIRVDLDPSVVLEINERAENGDRDGTKYVSPTYTMTFKPSECRVV